MKPVTVKPSACPSAERGTVDSSKRIEQVLQNPRSHFQESRQQWEARCAARAPRVLRSAGLARGREGPAAEKLLLTAVTTNGPRAA